MSYLNDINMMTRGADFWRNTIGNDLRAKAAADAAPSPAPVAQPQSNPMPELKIVNKPNTFRTMESLKPKTNMFTQFFPEASAPIAGTQVSNVKAEVNGKPLVNETVKTVSFEPVGPMEGNAFKTSVSYGSPDYEKLNGQTNWKMPWPKLVDEEEEQADYFSSLQKNRKNAGMNLPANPVAEVKAVAPVDIKPASAPVVESVEVKPAVPEVKPVESAFPEEHPTFTALKGTDYNNMFKPAPVEAPKPQVNPQPTAPSYGDIATDAYNKAMSNYALDEKNMEAQRGLVNQATNHDANIFRRQEEAYNTLKQQYEDAAKSQKEDNGGILDWVNPLGIVQGVTDPLFARKVYNPSTRSYESKGPSSLKDAVGNLVRNVATAGSGLQVSRRGKNWSFGYDPTMPNYFRSMQLNNAAAPFSTYEALQDELASGAVKPAFRPWTVNNPTPLAKHPYQNVADEEVARQYGFQALEDNAKQVAKLLNWEVGGDEYNKFIYDKLGLVQDAGTLVNSRIDQMRKAGLTEEQIEELRPELWKQALGFGGKAMTAKEAADVELNNRKFAADQYAAQRKEVNDFTATKAAFMKSLMDNNPWLPPEKVSSMADSYMNTLYGGNSFYQAEPASESSQTPPTSEPATSEVSNVPSVGLTELNNDFTGEAIKAERRLPKSKIQPSPRYELRNYPKFGQVAIDNSTGERVVPYNSQQMAQNRDELIMGYANIAAKSNSGESPSLQEVQNWLDKEEDYRFHTIDVKDNSIKGTGFDDINDKNGNAPGINQMRNEMLSLKEELINRQKAYDASSDTVKKLIDSEASMNSGDPQATEQFETDLDNLRKQIKSEERGLMLFSPRRDPVTGQTSYGYDFTAPETEAIADRLVADGASRSQIIAHIVPDMNDRIKAYYLRYHVMPNEETIWKAIAKPLLDQMDAPLQKAIQNDTFFGNEDPINRAIVGSFARKYLNTFKR